MQLLGHRRGRRPCAAGALGGARVVGRRQRCGRMSTAHERRLMEMTRRRRGGPRRHVADCGLPFHSFLHHAVFRVKNKMLGRVWRRLSLRVLARWPFVCQVGFVLEGVWAGWLRFCTGVGSFFSRNQKGGCMGGGSSRSK